VSGPLQDLAFEFKEIQGNSNHFKAAKA